MQDKVFRGVAEDRFTGAIESQTSKIPSSGYLVAAFGAITASAILKIVGKDDWPTATNLNRRPESRAESENLRYSPGAF